MLLFQLEFKHRMYVRKKGGVFMNMYKYMPIMIVVSLFIAGSALGVSYAPGAFDQKIKTFKNESGQPVIGIVITSQMTLRGPVIRDLRTGVIQPNGQEDITYTTPGTREIRFEDTSGKVLAIYVFDNTYNAQNSSEYILQSKFSVKPGEERIKIVETPNVDKRQ